jgi:hypothetical protein
MIGWSVCPDQVANNNTCLNSTAWQANVPYNTKMTISYRRAQTVYNRYNFTIIDILNLSDPIPTNYTPADFFPIYDSIFEINPNQVNFFTSTQYMFLTAINTFLGTNTDTENQSGGIDDRSHRLQDFLATPIFLFNNVVYGGPLQHMGNSISLGVMSYRV